LHAPWYLIDFSQEALRGELNASFYAREPENLRKSSIQ